jgi:hypothetical protein
MKQRKFIVWAGALILLCFAALLLGCPTEAEEEEEVVVEALDSPVVITGTETKYFSLTTGKRVSDSERNTENWDIAFSRNGSVGGLIYTNSGITASLLGSGGKGGVWYTDETDFDAVTSDSDKVTVTGEYAGLDVDATKYISTTTDGSGDGTAYVLNVMTYLGYAGSGDGNLASTPYRANTLSGPPTNYLPYSYNKHQFYKMLNMMQAQYEVTEEVYIIKHGNGTDYSKIQVKDYGSTGGKATFEVVYENLE